MAKKDKYRRSGVQIDDKYGIVAMPIDYALAEIKTDADGIYFVPFAYFGTFARCLQEYISQRIHDGLEVDSIISLSEAEKRIAQAFRASADTINADFPAYKVVEA